MVGVDGYGKNEARWMEMDGGWWVDYWRTLLATSYVPFDHLRSGRETTLHCRHATTVVGVR